VHVHEATQQAGGRCRSYYDGATDMVIDNGNHLLLSGNLHARSYALSIGSEAGLVGPERAQFDFVDLKTDKHWKLDLGNGRIPTWLFDKTRRVPDTNVGDYLALAPLAWAGNDALIGKTIKCEGTSMIVSCCRLCSRRSMSIRRKAPQASQVPSCARRCSQVESLVGR
jgi:hypothetical protein